MSKERNKAIVFTLLLFIIIGWWLLGMPGMTPNSKNTAQKTTKLSTKPKITKLREIGQKIDSYKGVSAFYNEAVANVSGRNKTNDGYNLGLKYQCVEFAKRFYYEAFNHKMPDSYGHAKDFYNNKYKHGSINKERNMFQYENGGTEKPKKNDLIVIGPSTFNSFGHLMVITSINRNEVAFIQQNPGPKNPSRGVLHLEYNKGKWSISSHNILGWLRLQ